MRIWLVALAVVVFVGVAFVFVGAAPPSRFVLATGAPEGAYARFGGQYAAALERRGVTVERVETAGAVENLALLTDEASPVQVGFLQGGLGPVEGEALVALGALYYEPVWLFCRAGLPCEQIRELAGTRVAVGQVGSGTRPVALDLLAANGVRADSTTFVDAGGMEAADQLLAGSVDAVFAVGSPEAEYVQRLFRDERARVVSLERAPAYQILGRHYARLTLPRGAVDLAQDLPARDVSLLAVTAMLVARSDLHPALIERLLEAAKEAHASGGIFEEPGEFPAGKLVDRPLSEHAAQYYESGLGFLSRALPFWAASLVKRLLVLLVPLIGVLLPLSKLLPAIYQWRIRSRLTRRYKVLLALDAESDELDGAEVERRLDEIVAEVDGIKVPPAYASALYDLRFHVARVRRRLAGGDEVDVEAPAV